MASIKVKFRASTAPGKEGLIYYQITHERKVRQLHTDYKVFPAEWDKYRSTVITTDNSHRKLYIHSICELIQRDVERLTQIERKRYAVGLAYSADEVIDDFVRYNREYSLVNYMEVIIGRLIQNGKMRTSETYRSTLNSFKIFLGETDIYTGREKDIMLDYLSSGIMKAYEAWLQNRGIVPNTISFYIRIIRAVYNRAVEDGMIENRNPFKHVYTGVDKTIKRALPLQMIRKIKILDLKNYPNLEFARDMFLMSFYLRGMSFVDMAYLKMSDLKNGYISYRRRKTGQLLVIEWTKEMQMIVDKYPDNASEYLLPIIRFRYIDERKLYLRMSWMINNSLKAIAGMAGITIPLTLYVARHSWASVAKAKGIPINVISEGMGHDNESTTRIYLASLDTSVVDRANSLILNSL